jgi:DNA-binding winged helix-turn-helix (wHTH) protein
MANLDPAADPSMDTEYLPELTTSPRYVRFGPFAVDRQRQQVYREGGKLRLQGKVYQVLLVLIQKQGEVVTREELKQALWPADTHVNYDANVNTTVNKLRQALGESTDKPAYIETIPRKGYSFIGAAEYSDKPFPQGAFVPPEEADPSAALPPPAAAEPPRDSAKWLTLVVIGLIVVGILLGAGVATLWIARFGFQLR